MCVCDVVVNAVYANSFYAALNTRRSVRGRGTENERTTVPTFLMVGQTTTFKNEAQEAGNGFSTVRVERARFLGCCSWG